MKKSRLKEIISEELAKFEKNTDKKMIIEAQSIGDEHLDQAIKAYSKQMGGVKNEEDLRDLHEALKRKIVERLKSILGVGSRREI